MGIQGNKQLILFRLTSGDCLNILDTFKTAFPEYFKIHDKKKPDFLDILTADQQEK